MTRPYALTPDPSPSGRGAFGLRPLAGVLRAPKGNTLRGAVPLRGGGDLRSGTRRGLRFAPGPSPSEGPSGEK